MNAENPSTSLQPEKNAAAGAAAIPAGGGSTSAAVLETEAVQSANFPEFSGPPSTESVDQAKHLELLRDVSLKVKVELGRGKLLLKDILRLAKGSVVELEKLAGDPLDIFVNDRLVARGEVLVLNDNFCIRITEILSPEECMRLKPN